MLISCYQFVKVKNFESNSQHRPCKIPVGECCYQFVKVKNFESNSQPGLARPSMAASCYQFVKVKNFESNSQRITLPLIFGCAVISLSKSKISNLLVAQALL